MTTQYGLDVMSRFDTEGVSPIVIRCKQGERKLVDREGVSGALLIQVEAGGELTYKEYIQDSGMYHTTIALMGEGARVTCLSKVRAEQSREIDISHMVYHFADRTESEIQARGVVLGTAQLIYRSGVYGEKGLRDLEGHSNAHILSAGEGEVRSIPSLAIATHRIVCSHAFSVSPVPEESLVYMALRGYDRGTATGIITDSFLI